jgi:hypothetical protein
MKKYILFISIVLLIVFLFGCTVNDNVGLIVLSNMTDIDIKNIKVGDTTLHFELGMGTKYDYWFFANITGKISANGVEDYVYTVPDPDKNNPNLKFEPGYEYFITVYKSDGDYYFDIGRRKAGADEVNDANDIDHPAD